MCGLLKRSWIQSWIWKCVLTENARLVYFVWWRGQQSFSIVAWTDSKTWQYNWKCSTECHSDSKCEWSQSLAPLILRKSQSGSEGSCWRYLTNTSDAKHTPWFYLSFHPLIRFIRSSRSAHEARRFVWGVNWTLSHDRTHLRVSLFSRQGLECPILTLNMFN